MLLKAAWYLSCKHDLVKCQHGLEVCAANIVKGIPEKASKVRLKHMKSIRTLVRPADPLCMALVGEQLLQESGVLHCLCQERHHLLLTLFCGL